MTSEAILVDITDNEGRNVKKGRTSFYSLPKTLSEDDDPFGVFQNPRADKQRSVGDGGLLISEIKEKEEPNTGLLVQIETESPRISISESFNSVSSRYDFTVVATSVSDTFSQELYLRHGCGHAGGLWPLLSLRNVSQCGWSLLR